MEAISFQQMEEVQHEIKISHLVQHQNVACYVTSFLVDTHLWAVQPLMHYGVCVCVCVCVCACVRDVCVCVCACVSLGYSNLA